MVVEAVGEFVSKGFRQPIAAYDVVATGPQILEPRKRDVSQGLGGLFTSKRRSDIFWRNREVTR
jgi:hypothetical protein